LKRALVTGGSGFLGSHIADTLTDRGFYVTIFDRQPSPHLREGQRMEAGDILDAEAIHRVVAEADLVYHLAGLADLDLATTSPLETARQNVLGTVNVLEAARESAIERLLFASTAYVYSRAGGFYR